MQIIVSISFFFFFQSRFSRDSSVTEHGEWALYGIYHSQMMVEELQPIFCQYLTEVFRICEALHKSPFSSLFLFFFFNTRATIYTWLAPKRFRFRTPVTEAVT